MPFPPRLLQPGEEVLVDTRPRLVRLLRPGLLVAVVLAASIAAVVVWASAPIWFGWVLIAAIGLSLLDLGVRTAQWRAEHLTITTRRVVSRAGILRRVGREIPLANVQSVSYRQSLLQRLMRTGDLLVESAGPDSREPFPDVPDPAWMQTLLSAAMEHLRSAAGAQPWPPREGEAARWDRAPRRTGAQAWRPSRTGGAVEGWPTTVAMPATSDTRPTPIVGGLAVDRTASGLPAETPADPDADADAPDADAPDPDAPDPDAPDPDAPDADAPDADAPDADAPDADARGAGASGTVPFGAGRLDADRAGTGALQAEPLDADAGTDPLGTTGAGRAEPVAGAPVAAPSAAAPRRAGAAVGCTSGATSTARTETAAGRTEPGGVDIVGQIERLAALYERGVLTRGEFEAKKAELLARL
jgi:membrane protein YdbS with pleckstrin-like domain